MISRPIILLSGCHGSGKSTLARGLSERHSLPYFPSVASQVNKKNGVRAGEVTDFKSRHRAQLDILDAWVDQWSEAMKQGAGVFDRCPIDMAAYMLSDVQRDTATGDSFLADEYVQKCVATMTQVVKAGGDYFHVRPIAGRSEGVHEGNGERAPVNDAYMHKLDYLMMGILCSTSIKVQMIQSAPIEVRLDLVNTELSRRFVVATMLRARG